MSFLDVMQTYFRGEKLEAIAFIVPAGLLLVGLGATALKAESGGFAWGVAIPCVVLGLVLIATGATVFLRTADQVAGITRGFEEAPEAMLASELPRMLKVEQLFKTTIPAFGGMAALGLLFVFVVRKDWALGAGGALVLAAGMGFLIDGFASRRAVPYTEALQQLANEHPVASAPK